MLPPDGPSPWQCLCRCLLPGRARRPRGAWVPSVAGVGAEGAGPSQARSCRHKGLVTPSLPGASGPWVRPGDCHPLLGGGCLPGPTPSAGWGRLTVALGEPPPSPHCPGLCHESLLGPTLLPASPPALWSPTEVCESLAVSSFSTPLFCHCLQTSAALSALCPLPPGRVRPSLCPGPAAWSLRLGPGPTEAGGVEGGRAGRRASGRLGGADCTALVLECLPFLALLAAALQPRLASCLPLAGQPQVSVPAGRPWSLLHRDPSRGQAGSLTVTHCALITLLMRQAPPLLFGSWLRPMVEEGQAGGRPAQAWPPVGKPQRDSTLQARAVLPLPLPLPQQNPVCGLGGVSPGASVQHGSSRRRSGRPGWVLQNRPRARPLRLPKGQLCSEAAGLLEGSWNALWGPVGHCTMGPVPLGGLGLRSRGQLKILPVTGKNKMSLSPSRSWVPPQSNTVLNTAFTLVLEAVVKHNQYLQADLTPKHDSHSGLDRASAGGGREALFGGLGSTGDWVPWVGCGPGGSQR